MISFTINRYLNKRVGIKTILVIFYTSLFLLCGLVDIPSQLTIGAISMQAILTIIYPIITWLLCFLYKRFPTELKIISPLIMFLIWDLFSFFWFPPKISGFQNVLVFLSFVGLIILSALVSNQYEDFAFVTRKYLFYSTILAFLIYSFSIITDGLGSKSIIGPRSFSLYALMGLALFISEMNYGKKKWGLAFTIITVVLITLSLSRTATIISFCLIIISKYKRSIKGLLKSLFFLVLISTILYSTINNFEPLRARFLEGDNAANIGDTTINTSGRTVIWGIVIDSYLESPIIGKGAGSSEDVVKNYLVTITHPHNDYLRVLHDYGILGFVLWVIGLILLFRNSFKSWMKTDKQKNYSEAKIHLSAFLSLAAITLSSITDNTIVYIFVMIPAAILIGNSIGISKKQ